MKSKKLKYKDRSIKIRNVNGNFQEYNITEDQFSKLPIDKMLKYIIHNNKNVNEFNEYFYNDLRKIKENVPRKIIIRKSRFKHK